MASRWQFFALCVVLSSGCSSSGWPGAEQQALDAGPIDRAPDVRAPSPMDGGVGHPASDASDLADATAMAPTLPPNFVLECQPAEPLAAREDPFAAWQAERSAHGPMGYEASLALRGNAYRVTGAGVTAAVDAPLALRVDGPTSGLIGFGEASVEGVAETGRVELYAGDYPTDDLGHASARAGSIEGLVLEEIAVEGGMLEGAIALTTERVGNTDRHHATAIISGLAVDNARIVRLYPDESSGGGDRIEWMPSGPVVFGSASALTFYGEGGASLVKDLSDPIELHYPAFGLAGDFTGGTVDAGDLDVAGTPLAVFGNHLSLRVEDEGPRSQGSFRLTQAVNEAGLVIPAAVEVVPAVNEVWVEPGETRVVRVHYRETSYAGDAVLAEIEADGAAEDLLELQTGFMQTLTQQLIEAVIDTGWAAPLAGLATLPTLSIVFVIDIFDCIFGGCAAHPAPLDPFPQWLPAGEMDTMEVRVKGDRTRGTYQTSLTFVGRNYCPTTMELTVHVGEQPADADADADVGLE